MSRLSKINRREFLGGAAAVLARQRLQAANAERHAAPAVFNLRCEYAEAPLGIDILEPRLSWNLESSRRGAGQVAYRILVSSTPELLRAGKGDLWDSGRTESADSSQVVYQGTKLQPQMRAFWKVHVWDENNVSSDWSDPASWEMGLLQSVDWLAKWIGAPSSDPENLTYTPPAPYFRKTFEITKPVASARAYVSGLGFYELYLNGAKVGDNVLSPNQTNYDIRDLDRLAYPFDDKTSQRVDYLTFDVSDHLQTGKNAAGIILGNGWYNQRDRIEEGSMWYGLPRLIFQLVITFMDGTQQTLVSDETWRVSTSGPIIHNGIFTGERYDARLEMHGWSTAAYDDSAWSPVNLMAAPAGRLTAQYASPDRIMQTIPAVSATRVSPELLRLDFGQNLAGWVRLKVHGSPGTSVPMQFFEEIDGRTYGQSDCYVLKGGEAEVYEPRFTWHGFQFVEVRGSQDLLTNTAFEARVVHTDVEETGSFRCSNNLFNTILHNCRWSQHNNMHCGVPSDCPHRERVGYTGDWGHVSAEAAIFNFDMARFYTKWLNDIGDAQNRDTGFVPHSAPYEGGGGGPPWGSAIVALPWLLHLYYGDRRVMEEHYSGMRHWIEYLRTRADRDGVLVREEAGGWDLGEWATPGKIEIPPELVNTCYYAYVAQLVAKSARILGKNDDIAYFNGLARAAAAAVNRRFFNESRAQYWEGRQGANVFPLAFGLVPAAHRQAVFNRMVDIIVNENHSHFDTGIFATRLALQILTAGGRGDVAYAMMNQRTFPSFGWQIDRGATTLWENWDGSGSHNHAMFGGVCQWFYQSLAGINPDPEAPGFRHILVQPYPLDDLTFAEASYRSLQGTIRSSWKKQGDEFHLSLDIPSNCAATVILPAGGRSKVYESGTLLNKARGVSRIAPIEGRLGCKVGSGHYEFTVAASVMGRKDLGV